MQAPLAGCGSLEQNWDGSDKKWNVSSQFKKKKKNSELLSVLRREHSRLIGTVPLFVGPVPVLFCRVKEPLFPACNFV